jgi:hypothetical protein
MYWTFPGMMDVSSLSHSTIRCYAQDTTTIPFELPEAAHVRIAVYNSLGERVRVLVDRELTAGRRDGRFTAGDLPSGVYYVRMTVGGYRATQGVVLVE